MGAGGSQQVHDFNPAEENGLFWTVPSPTNSVHVDFDDGTAALALGNFQIDNYGNVGNAISGGSEIGTARLSLRVRWSRPTKHLSYVNGVEPTPFRVKGFQTGATMDWSAVETIRGVTHRLSGATNSEDFAMVAREKNGVFFEREDEDDDGEGSD